MTHDQLVAFLAVATSGAFTAASRRLHKSQPAVSKLVRNLEDELGVALFDRAAYRATLTDAGRRFYERAAAVVESTEALKTFGQALAGRIEPIVRLAVEAVTPLAPVMAVLNELQSEYPVVRIELSTERLTGAIDALRSDRADLAIATKVGVATTRLVAAPFCRVGIVPVARHDHPLARTRGPIAPALLRAHAQIVLRDSAETEGAPSLNVLAGTHQWRVTDVLAKKEIISAGMGWGGLPDHVVAEELASGELVALDIPEFEAREMMLFVLRRPDRAHGVVADTAWRRLRDAAPPTPSRSAGPSARRPRQAPRSAARHARAQPRRPV